MKIDSFEQAVEYLYKTIPHSNATRFPGAFGLARARELQTLIGSPQNNLKIVHIAGTSGKGSTAYFTSGLLCSLGFKVGLFTKPHILDIRERFQINNKLIPRDMFRNYLEEITLAIEQMKKTEFGTPSYFEVIVALSYHIFAREKVNYAVIETGVGGLYDGSNTIERSDKVAVLTPIGFDHMDILGNTLTDIAEQKAMIMQKGNIAFSTHQDPSVLKVLTAVAEKQQAVLHIVPPEQTVQHIRLQHGKTFFDFSYKDTHYQNIALGIFGKHQVENASIALTVVSHLSKRDHFTLEEKKMRAFLQHAHFIARMDIFNLNETSVIVDGAHNRQKMRAFLADMKSMFPHEKFHLLIGFKKGKEIDEMLKQIIPLASDITVTSFFTDKQDWSVKSEPIESVTQMLSQRKFNKVSVVENPHEALTSVLNKKGKIIVTGSLYLIGEIYKDLRLSLK